MATFNNIDTLAELKAAIAQSSGNSEADVINITGNITLNDNDAATDDSLPLISESVGLTINGGNHTISGDNQQRIFFVRSGNIVFDDLTLTQGLAQGGNSFRGVAVRGWAAHCSSTRATSPSAIPCF